MLNILEQIQKQKAFDAFINENMKTSTYRIGWDREMDVEYEASKTYAAGTAEYAAAMLGTVISEGAPRPKRDMPSIGELTGTIARMGDEWEIPNDRLERYYYMLGRLRDKAKNLSETQKKTQYQSLVRYLFNPYELAAIAPHRRILAQYWEGFSDGQVTVAKTNNQGGIVWSAPLSNGITKKMLPKGSVVWSTATLATMDVLATLQHLEDMADAAGKTVLKFRVSKSTAALISNSSQLKSLIGMNLGRLKADTTPMLAIDTVNSYLSALQRPTIEVIDEKGVLNTGASVNLFKDGRVVAQCADKVAVLKVSDPLETIDPVPNKTYTSYFDNLISQWRNDNGRYVAYEMFGYPVFTGKNDVFILDVTTAYT